MAPMLSHIGRVNQVRLLGVLFISSLKATLYVDTVLSIISQRLYLLSQLKAEGLPSDSLQIIFHALILSTGKYALPAIAGLLSETDKSRLGAFFRKAKRRGLCHSDFFISQLVDRAERRFLKVIQLSHHCLNPLSCQFSPSILQVFP